MASPAFGLHFRRYAPFAKFGFPSFKGDNRTQPSTSLQATSRTYGAVLFRQEGIISQFAGSSGTEDANLVLHFLERKAMAKVSIKSTRSAEAGPGLIGFSASTAGANPLMPGSPDIDTTVEVRIDWGADRAMRVNGTVSGDDFPNLEVFIRCYQSKHSALIVDGRTGRGPVAGPVSLFGGGGKLCAFSASIPLTAAGLFSRDQTCGQTKI
jgi:hypothetical protein